MTKKGKIVQALVAGFLITLFFIMPILGFGRSSAYSLENYMLTVLLFIGVPWFFLLIYVVAALKGMQKLRVFVPVPLGVSARVAALLLNTEDDSQIYAFLKKHGKTQSQNEGTIIKYWGDRVYDSLSKQFVIGTGKYKPEKVKILREG